MAEIVDIPTSDLLLDGGNARLAKELDGQQETALGLAEQQGEKLVKLAEDIVRNGTDPTTLPAVVAVGDTRKRYKIVEGNRRVLALKALETPTLVMPALSQKDGRKLAKLSSEYANNPLEELPCVLFKSEEEVRHWIELRHTGQNGGRGLVDWEADEKDRFNARHSGGRNPAGQVIDFVDRHGALSAQAQTSKQKIFTTLARLLSSPDVRRKLGIDLSNGEVVALHTTEAVAKSLTYVVEQLKIGDVTVPDVYTAEDRGRYASSIPTSVTPKKKTLLETPVSLAGLTAGQTKPAATKSKKKAKPKPPRRTAVIPKAATLNVTPPRINAIYYELLSLAVEQYPNACAVLLRVFVELSIDHFVEEYKLPVLTSDPLAKRLKAVTKKLSNDGTISTQLQKATDQIADGPTPVAPGVSTFHQYVHNRYSFPKASELFAAWDELQPLMEILWPA
jgi:hypothetical protein